MNTFTDFLKNPFSLKTAVGYKNILWGISLMLMAASYSIGNAPFRIIISAIALIMSIISLGTNFHKKDEEDEMYKRHIGREYDLRDYFICFICSNSVRKAFFHESGSSFLCRYWWLSSGSIF